MSFYSGYNAAALRAWISFWRESKAMVERIEKASLKIKVSKRCQSLEKGKKA